jgi:hypothetical protein
MPHVDVGHGWLIFGLPPAEVAVHPSEENNVHEFYLMCDDVDGFVAEMKERDVECGPVQSMGWGRLTQVELPGGGKLGVYQPRHARPKAMAVRRKASKKSKAGPKKGRPSPRPAGRSLRETRPSVAAGAEVSGGRPPNPPPRRERD